MNIITTQPARGLARKKVCVGVYTPTHTFFSGVHTTVDQNTSNRRSSKKGGDFCLSGSAGDRQKPQCSQRRLPLLHRRLDQRADFGPFRFVEGVNLDMPQAIPLAGQQPGRVRERAAVVKPQADVFLHRADVAEDAFRLPEPGPGLWPRAYSAWFSLGLGIAETAFPSVASG